MVIVDANGVPISSELTLSNSAVDEEMLEVDGDGTTWVVGWLGLGFLNAPAAFAASFSFDARTRTFVTNTTIPLDSGYRGPTPPSVTWIGDSVLFGYSSTLATNPSFREALVRSYDPFLCSVCESSAQFGAEFPIGSNTRIERTPFACAAVSAGGTGEDVLMAWPQNDVTSTNTDIIIRRWQTVDGGTASLGGGCGEGGTNRATCARSPNPVFTHRLRDSIPSAPTVFLMAATQLGLQCGPCTLVPNPAEIALVLNTDASGEVALRAAIPAASPLIGVPLFTQWATIDLATPACTLFPIDLSNALRVLIQ